MPVSACVFRTVTTTSGTHNQRPRIVGGTRRLSNWHAIDRCTGRLQLLHYLLDNIGSKDLRSSIKLEPSQNGTVKDTMKVVRNQIDRD